MKLGVRGHGATFVVKQTSTTLLLSEMYSSVQPVDMLSLSIKLRHLQCKLPGSCYNMYQHSTVCTTWLPHPGRGGVVAFSSSGGCYGAASHLQPSSGPVVALRGGDCERNLSTEILHSGPCAYGQAICSRFMSSWFLGELWSAWNKLHQYINCRCQATVRLVDLQACSQNSLKGGLKLKGATEIFAN